MSDFETYPPGTARRIAELEADNERLQARVETLEGALAKIVVGDSLNAKYTAKKALAATEQAESDE